MRKMDKIAEARPCGLLLPAKKPGRTGVLPGCMFEIYTAALALQFRPPICSRALQTAATTTQDTSASGMPAA